MHTVVPTSGGVPEKLFLSEKPIPSLRNSGPFPRQRHVLDCIQALVSEGKEVVCGVTFRIID